MKTLYIAPDGILNLISFASLKLPNGKYLVQRNQINRLQTGRDLLPSPFSQKPSDILVAVGGVDYGDKKSFWSFLKQSLIDILVGIGLKDDSEKFIVQKGQLNEKAASELKEMDYLKYSREEAALIKETYIEKEKGKVFIYPDPEKENPEPEEGKRATESVLKNMKKPPKILHLSTHGFYLEKERIQPNPFILSGLEIGSENWWMDWIRYEEQPLLLSGVALANANLGLRGKVDDNDNDGLLHALEVLELNLQGTELVSLSACNTGKGVIDYSEGVYGLVRAFRTAGAKNVLMTLSPVGDASSKEFFIKFYDTWLSSSLTPAEALHETRLHFIEKYPDNPKTWSPYVMVGG